MPDFPDVMLIAGKQRKRGTLSIPDQISSQSSNQSLDFKPKNASKPVSIRCADIEGYLWYHSFDGYTLGLKLTGGAQVKFNQINQSIQQTLYNALEKLAASTQQTVKKITLDTKGSNVGELEIADRSMTFFSTDAKPVFELPFHSIAQAVAQSRNEVALELHTDDAPSNQSEQLVEIRMYLPEEAAPEDDDMADEREAPASIFAREIQVKGDLGVGAGTSALAEFSKLLFAVPRGRYDVELFTTFFKLSSATYTYKIAYKNVNKMFLFELLDAGQHLFVIGLNPPVRQGRTAYPYLVMQFDSAETREQAFPGIDEKTAEEKYKGMIKPVMNGPMHDIVTRVFKALSSKKVLIASQSFSSTNNGAAIQCSYKANEGHLFFLEKSFFFLKKPPMHIRHADIQSIVFDRLSSANKRFAVTLSCTEGGKTVEYGFTNISRDEYEKVHSFMQGKNLPIASNGAEENEEQSKPSRADFSEDAYMARISGDASEAGAAAGATGAESDSENDEDFTAESDDDSSSGGSSGSDSDASMASEVSDEEVSSKPQKGKADKKDTKENGKKKAAKRAKSSGSEQEEEEEEKKPAKKKAAPKKDQPKKKKKDEDDD